MTAERKPMTAGPLAWCISEQATRRILDHRCETCGGPMLGVGK